MRGRLQDQIAAIFSLVLLVALAAGTYYIAEFAAVERSDEVDPARKHEPDYFVDGLAAVKLNSRGDPVFRISALRMQHFPDDGSTEYDEPRLISLDSGDPPMTVRARHARADANGVDTHLSGEVVLVRMGDDAAPDLTITTEALTVDSDAQIARTNRPVTIERGRSRLTGVGMEFNNSARQLRVDADVRGIWYAIPSATTDDR